MAITECPCPVCELTCEKRGTIRYDRESAAEVGPDGKQLILDDAHFYACKQCGEYIVLDNDEFDNLAMSNGKRSKNHPGHRLSCMLRERYIRQQTPTFVQFRGGGRQYAPLAINKGYTTCHVNELLAGFPRDAVEKIDRSLLNLATMVGDSPWLSIEISLIYDRAMFYESDDGGVDYILRALASDGNRFIQYVPKINPEFQLLSITPNGWRRVRELTPTIGNTEAPVFVAMAFGKTGSADWDAQKSLYDNAIAKAVVHCGYKVKRADSDRHNDFIMNKMLGDIRAAPFVVADFTHNRGGVYFEAGFGRGLGRPVIHSCNRQHLEQLHFDTAQISHITWDTEAELYRELFHTIRSTVGTGPYKDQIREAPED